MNQPRPFNIRILVAEGIPDGLRLVEKSNWVGLGIICPRGRYPEVKKRSEFDGSGVYILVGSEGEGEYPMLYVGEAETVRDRLNSHYANKDFWQQAIDFTTRGDPLNKAEVQYLEARLIELARASKRCRLDNQVDPQRPGLSEADLAQVDGYLHEVLSLLPVIGIRAFEQAEARVVGKTMFHWHGSGWEAWGYQTSNGFAVQKDSTARGKTVPSMSTSIDVRERLISDGVLIEGKEGFVFTTDYEFSSPSQAASVVAGRNTNGREAWKDKKGVMLKTYQQREVEG